LTATDSSGTRTFNYTADGQYTGATHDASGRFSAWNGWSFTAYDANGRLTEACEDPCGTSDKRLTFTYDADGRRTGITETVGSTSTTTELRYVDGRISAEYVDGVLTRSYVTDESGAVVKMVIPGGQPNAGTYLVTWNGHGDALNLLHLDAGTLTLANSFTYDTWGAATVSTHNGHLDLGFRFRYIGQHGVQDDSLLDMPLLLMGARHYASELGRFIQPDPSRQEENHYTYAGNNPTSRIDPDGTFFWVIVVAVVRVAVSVAVRALPRLVVGSAATWLRIAGYRWSSHVFKHGVSLFNIARTIAFGYKFRYFHNGICKVGFYWAPLNLFVGTNPATGWILTAFSPTRPPGWQYVYDLMRARC
jgi:RHS repeat-associated protein